MNPFDVSKLGIETMQQGVKNKKLWFGVRLNFFIFMISYQQNQNNESPTL
jgi:hypothetical protein